MDDSSEGESNDSSDYDISGAPSPCPESSRTFCTTTKRSGQLVITNSSPSKDHSNSSDGRDGIKVSVKRELECDIQIAALSIL